MFCLHIFTGKDKNTKTFFAAQELKSFFLSRVSEMPGFFADREMTGIGFMFKCSLFIVTMEKIFGKT